MKNKLPLIKITVFFLFLICFSNADAQLKYRRVIVSDSGTTNSIGAANTSKNIAISPFGMIGVVYTGNSGVRFAKSTNGGQSFLPSIKLSSATTGEAEINMAANGNIYIVHANKIYISSDEGNSFISNTYQTGGANVPHVTSYGDDVYILVSGTKKVYRNNNNGLDTFYSTTIGGASAAFSDIYADPSTGNVYVPSDNPTVYLDKSTTGADTFVNVPITPSSSIFFSSYAISNGPSGSFLFAAGLASNGLKFNLNTNTNSVLTYANNTGNNDRTLAADDLGDLVDGYKSGSRLSFRVSKDFGNTFDTSQYFTDTVISHNIAINTFTQDVVTVFSGTDGKIYLNVHEGLLNPRTVALPTITTFGTLNDFVKCNSGNSSTQSFRVKGINLNKNIIVKAPAGFLVSSNATTG
ncbi:MAG: hypothetical protein ACOVP1_06315, partial [Bacteroidia bacterium]